MNNKLYIWGWWQGNNLGDNWIKKTLSIVFPNAIFIDTSVHNFEKNSFVICGGGGLFIYDVITPWDNLPKDISYGILGLGAEFRHESKKAISVCNNAKFFYVRDKYSLECMHIDGIERSYDLTFTLPLYWTKKMEVNSDKLFFVWRDGHELLNNSKFKEYIGDSSDSYNKWKKIIEQRFKIIVEDDFQTRNDNVEERIGNAGFVISGRYHGIVAAIQKGLPFIAIDICPKIRALLEECGLEEYCVKIYEFNRVDLLIEKARDQIDEIRKKEKKYVDNARKVLQKQIEIAKLEILKKLKPLNIIHYGSYWMGENDVVNTMADDLEMECNLKKIDLKVYSAYPDKRIKINENTPNGKICVLNHKKILRDIKKHKADAIILNSGGLHLADRTVNALRRKGVITIGISLSDPDVFPYNGKIYANKFDFFYTNSRYSLENEYPETGANVRIFPFAASTKHHYYMPNIEKKYDVVVVAHSREDRMLIVEKLEEICEVGTYGSGWKHSLGVVNGLDHVKAINSGKMYLSFAKTVAGFDNVKVGLFEAIACNQVVITSYMKELENYFKIGKEILCYETEEELYEIVKYYLKHEKELEEVRRCGYRRFLKDHTYQKRWNDILKNIYCQKHIFE